MPTTPAASHASWRIASGDIPSAPGAWVALYTVITPRQLTARAKSGRSHSKWTSSRRSNRIGLLRLGRRTLPTGEVSIEDLLRDGRRDGPAVLARMLDQHGDRELRILDGREGDEPGVVALRPRVAIA